LEYNEKLKKLFRSISDLQIQRVLYDEYNDIKFLQMHEKWKDIAIKMGSILDFLTYDYFEQNSIIIPNKSNPTFHDRLVFIRTQNLIGVPNDWFLADQILRDYRNFIHLQIMIKQNIKVDKATIDILQPIFEKIILLF